MDIKTADKVSLYEQGAAIRRELVGEERFARSAETTYARPFMKEFIDAATTGVFGVVWARPGLDLKTRTLVVCVSDISNGHLDELDIHLQMALRTGWTRVELAEAILQLMGYVGCPAVRKAMEVASDVFDRMDSGTSTMT